MFWLSNCARGSPAIAPLKIEIMLGENDVNVANGSDCGGKVDDTVAAKNDGKHRLNYYSLLLISKSSYMT